MEKKKTKWTWLKKFGYAFRGLFTSIKEEMSLVVHLIIGLIVLVVAALLHKQMQPLDWAVIVLVIGVVIGMELLNTAIENLVDIVAFKYNYNAKKIKDISAAATLVLTITSIVVGLIIFIPKIIAIF
ncbi:MAG: diacylglycerol kinase [Mycoplasmataceae bacterium]|nr:diacylglycerol kinase [Mycoplasmataceae bacterium]